VDVAIKITYSACFREHNTDLAFRIHTDFLTEFVTFNITKTIRVTLKRNCCLDFSCLELNTIMTIAKLGTAFCVKCRVMSS
jgi:hypothetical protein